jgi:hypothetical protein
MSYSPESVSQSPQVGYLRNDGAGFYVVCVQCAGSNPEDTHPEDNRTPVFAENLSPYRQPCALCERELIEPNAGTILFDGSPVRRSGSTSM